MRILIAISLFSQLFGASQLRAAFDIGTGKIKMQIGWVYEDHIEALYCQAEPISLLNASILSKEGKITSEGEERIVEVLQSLQSEAKKYGASKFDAVATELFRSAVNGQEVAERLSALTHIPIRIISSEEEGILSFLTIVEEAKLNPEETVVLDVGSGSFQISCKEGDRFLVFSAPFGRMATYSLVKTGRLEMLQTALNCIDPRILKKIQDCKHVVMGIGAHPKHILESKTIYNQRDLNCALETCVDEDINYTDLLLMKMIMESFSIRTIDYRAARAGNTSGIFTSSNNSRLILEPSSDSQNN